MKTRNYLKTFFDKTAKGIYLIQIPSDFIFINLVLNKDSSPVIYITAAEGNQKSHYISRKLAEEIGKWLEEHYNKEDSK